MWIMVGIALCAFGITLVMAKHFNKEITKNIEAAFKKYMYYLLDIPYTVFIVLISLFPLLGMLGTVSALLTLDITGATEGLKANFFQALDTTGLGLICAIVGKLINAFFQPHIEFTSLLDVIMIILFFFILFSHLETEDAKIAMQAAQQSAVEREKQAALLLEDADKLLEEAMLKERQASEKLNEAELAGERQGENVEGITDFSRGLNIRVKLKMISGSSEWSLLVYKGEQQTAEISKGEVGSMSQAFLNALSDMGCEKDDTLLCMYVYDAAQAGTASADRDAQRVFDEVKEQYEHFFYSELDTSLFAED